MAPKWRPNLYAGLVNSWSTLCRHAYRYMTHNGHWALFPLAVADFCSTASLLRNFIRVVQSF